MNSMTGEQSICFEKPPYLFASASVAGKKEGEGPLGEIIRDMARRRQFLMRKF